MGHPKRKLVFQPSIFRCYVSFEEGKHKFVPVRKSLKWQWLIWWTCPCHVFQMPPTATQMVAFCTLCEAGPAPALCRTLQGANMREGDSYHYIHATAYHVIFIFIIFQYVSSIHFVAPSICTILETSSQLIIAPSTEIDITLLSSGIMEGDLGCNWCKAQKDAHVRDDHQHLL